MGLALDPQIATALERFPASVAPFPVGDWESRRRVYDSEALAEADRLSVAPGVQTEHLFARAHDETAIRLRVYRRAAESSGALVLYLHGGGHICGSLDITDTVCRRYVLDSGVTIVSVDYRLAPEHPYPSGLEDAYAALGFIHSHARELGGDPSRIAVMGGELGGGMAAGLALMTRDRGGPQLAAQLLIYPMLDDTTVIPDPEIAPLLTWSYDDNATGWMALLGHTYGSGAVAIYAAPARARDLRGLPPAFIDVGELDAFREENIAYASRLARAGVSVELYVRPGAPHSFETIAPHAAVSVRAGADRARVLAAL